MALERTEEMTTANGWLAGKKALVTGGSRGIGAAIARRLVDEGATVVINYRASADAAEALVKELDGDGGRVAAALQADVSDPAAAKGLVERAVATLGGLDVLVSNAGLEHFGSFFFQAEDGIRDLIVTGVQTCALPI